MNTRSGLSTRNPWIGFVGSFGGVGALNLLIGLDDHTRNQTWVGLGAILLASIFATLALRRWRFARST